MDVYLIFSLKVPVFVVKKAIDVKNGSFGKKIIETSLWKHYVHSPRLPGGTVEPSEMIHQFGNQPNITFSNNRS